MSHRFLTSLCGFGVVVIVAVLVPPAVTAQLQRAAVHGDLPPRTPWGHPDLQGIWSNATITPLERPEEFADKEFLSAEEAANLEQQTVARNEQLLNQSAQRTEAGGNVGAYNNFWMDRGTMVVSTKRTSLIVDPRNGRLPALTQEAHERVTSPEAQRLVDVRRGRFPAESWEQFDLGERCIWYRGIPAFPTGYNNNYHIVQNSHYVAILQEHINEVRMIPLDGRPHIGQAIRGYMGDSRGHWEGETLVVETTHFNDKAFIRGFRGILTEALHVVERFTRIGSDTLDYEFTVDDPGTWTRPWSGSLPMARIPGPIFEYACHEGNYGMMNILAGSRAQEKAAKSGK